MTQSTASGRVLHLMITVLHRRGTSPAETIHHLATHLGVSTAGEMDQLDLTLANFTALPAEPLDQFVWRLHMAVDEYNSRAPVYKLRPYSDRIFLMQLLRVLPPFLTDAFMAPLAAAGPGSTSYHSLEFLSCYMSASASIKRDGRHPLSWVVKRLLLLASDQPLSAVAPFPLSPRRTRWRPPPVLLLTLAPDVVSRRPSASVAFNRDISRRTAWVRALKAAVPAVPLSTRPRTVRSEVRLHPRFSRLPLLPGLRFLMGLSHPRSHR